jgi:hypothetical protein
MTEARTAEYWEHHWRELRPRIGNRSTDTDMGRRHIRKLTELIYKYGYDDACPILVTEDGIIQEGHHRWEACRILGVSPRVLIVSARTSEEIADKGQGAKSWTLQDRVTARAAEGDAFARQVLALQGEYDRAHLNACVVAMGRNVNLLPASVWTMLSSEELRAARHVMDLAEEVRQAIRSPSLNQRTVGAVKVVCAIPGFNTATFVRQVRSHGREMLLDATTRRVMVVAIVRCYNYRLQTKSRLPIPGNITG